jgi:hypothetical protein
VEKLVGLDSVSKMADLDEVVGAIPAAPTTPRSTRLTFVALDSRAFLYGTTTLGDKLSNLDADLFDELL